MADQKKWQEDQKKMELEKLTQVLYNGLTTKESNSWDVR
jgi:hypothetical protein